MELYNQGKVVSLEKLKQLSIDQKVEAWLIGQIHGGKECIDFEKKCIKLIRPEFILAEGEKKLSSRSSYDLVPAYYLPKIAKEIGAKYVNCDTADKKTVSLGIKVALISRYGTADLGEIAKKFYGVKVIIKKMGKGHLKDMKRYVEGEQGYVKWWDDTKEIIGEGRDSAVEKEIGKNISKYIIKSEKSLLSVIGVLGCDHLKLRAGNLYKQLEGKILLVINPFEILDKTTFNEDRSSNFRDLSKMYIVKSYDAVILRP